MRLSLNEEPRFISYAHHTFVNAIMEQKNNGIYLDMIVKNGSARAWNKVEKETTYVWDKDQLRVEGNPYAMHTDSSIWTECANEDELDVEIKYFRYTNANAIVNLFISSEDVMHCLETNQEVYRVGKVRKIGLLIRCEKKFVNRKYSGEFSRMKLVRNGNRISASVLTKEGWLVVDSKELPEEMNRKKLQIGININMGEDQYYNWLFMNYLQLYYNRTDGFVRLDYYMFARKNYGFLHFMQFLDTDVLQKSDVLDLFGDVHRCIHWNLDHNYYTQVDLDEYYVPNRKVYAKEHLKHTNLIYGYDDEKQEYTVLGFNVKPVITQVPYEIVEQAINGNFSIKRYRYNPNVNTIKFDLQRFLISLEEFIHSVPSNYHTSNLLGNTDDVFGLNALKELLDTEDGRYHLATDIRLVYVLYEYNMIMQQRLDFLVYRGYLKKNVEELKQRCHNMINIGSIMNNAFMVNQRKGKTEPIKLYEDMSKLYDMEKEFVNLLYASLI